MDSNKEQQHASTVSIFEGFNKPIEDKGLLQILTDIREGLYKDGVEKVRSAFKLEGKEIADKLKRQLLAFTPCALFRGGRKIEFLISYSQFLVLDLDDLNELLEPTFANIASCPITYSCFRSPGGNGLKILVEVTSHREHHDHAFGQVANYFEKLLQVSIDRSGKDITRLCFMSYDPAIYINPQHQKFEVDISVPILSAPVQEAGQGVPLIPQQSLATVSNKKHCKDLFQKCIAFTDKKMLYHEGNRNNYIHLLACNANRNGIPELETQSLISQSFDLDPTEINSIIKGVFKRNTHQSGNFKLEEGKEKIKGDINEISRPVENTIIDKNPQADLLNMPCIPEAIFSNLPELLIKGTLVFNTSRERDIFLTGAITILSGCVPNVEGIYDQRTVYSNLNCFIISPAASGKSALVLAKALGQAYHNRLLKESREALKRYNAELQLYKSNLQKRKKGDAAFEEEPQRPLFKILFIPGNSSSAAVIRHLMDGDEKGIFCETEADTMGNSLKQDWGGYSDLLRKAFQHESISYSRKTNQEFLEIHKPRLSVALSGTPSQVQGLIKSAEDGLFSRFIFYTFKVIPEWRDVSPNQNKPNLTQHFEILSNMVLEMVDFLERYPTSFDLNIRQWEVHNQKCTRWLKEMHVFVSEEATSSVKRLGLIVFRIAMVLSALRKFENGDTSQHIVCEDVDFETAFSLADVFLQHAIYMFHKLPKTESISDLKLKRFYTALPSHFQRKEAVETGKNIQVEERTTDKYLSLLLKEDFLTQAQYGHYSKN